MEGASHSSLTTLDHRWPVERYVRRFRTKLLDRTTRKRSHTKLSAARVPMFATTETLRYFDRVPAAAPCTSLPRTAHFTDDYVELLTWFWTEGHIRLSRGKPTSGVAIYQSHEANPAYVDRIRSCLSSLFGPDVPELSKGGDTVPRWRETVNGHKTEFFLNHVAGARLLSDAPNKAVLPSFIAALTPRQLKLFVDTAVAADGSSEPSGHRSVAQKEPRRLEALQMACALLGIRTNLTSAGGRFPPAARSSRFSGAGRSCGPSPRRRQPGVSFAGPSSTAVSSGVRLRQTEHGSRAGVARPISPVTHTWSVATATCSLGAGSAFVRPPTAPMNRMITTSPSASSVTIRRGEPTSRPRLDERSSS